MIHEKRRERSFMHKSKTQAREMTEGTCSKKYNKKNEKTAQCTIMIMNADTLHKGERLSTCEERFESIERITAKRGESLVISINRDRAAGRRAARISSDVISEVSSAPCRYTHSQMNLKNFLDTKIIKKTTFAFPLRNDELKKKNSLGIGDHNSLLSKTRKINPGTGWKSLFFTSPSALPNAFSQSSKREISRKSSHSISDSLRGQPSRPQEQQHGQRACARA